MKQSARKFLLLINLLLLTFLPGKAQNSYPQAEGDLVRYSSFIEIRKAYISGVCILALQNGILCGSIFNEFGISALDFSYRPDKEKVKIHSIMEPLNKWYIKKVLKRDIRQLLSVLKEGGTQYNDGKYGLTFTFTPLTNEEDNYYETKR